jgi:hypothetical protein
MIFNKMKKIVIITCLCFCISATTGGSATECDIVNFYNGVTPDKGTKCLMSGYNTEMKEVDVILVPVKIDAGKYTVSLSRTMSNLYKIDGTDLYVETTYCYEYANRHDAILIVESGFGYNKGKIIF